MSNYKILNIPDNSSKEDVKKAYRRLSKIYHPDINGGDPKKTAQFVKVKEAYESILNGVTGIKVEKAYTRSSSTRSNPNIKESFEVLKGYYDKNGNFKFEIKTSYIQKIYLVNNAYASNIYYDRCSWDLNKSSYDNATIIIDIKDLRKENYMVGFRLVGWVSGNITYKTYKVKRPKGFFNKLFDLLSEIF